MKWKLGLWMLLLPCFFTPSLPAVSGPEERFLRVHCEQGETLEKALGKVGERLVIEFSGTCHETVVIARNRVTLRGVGEQPTVEGSISIPGAIQIHLEDLRVINSPGSGIEALEGAAVTLRNIAVDTTGDRGINIRNSTADVAGIDIQRAGNAGLVIRGSSVLMGGSIRVNNNPLAGMSVTEGSSVFVKNGHIEANENPFGVLVQLSSTLAVIEGSVVTNRNEISGIIISSLGVVTMERNTFEALDNGFLGIWLNQFGSFATFSGSTPPVVLSGNGLAGALVEKRSFLELNANTLITENLFGGLLVSESSIQLTEVTIQDNAVLDISMRFGAQATFFDGNMVGSPIDCDATVMTRGPLSCAPSPLSGEVGETVRSWPELPAVSVNFTGFLPAPVQLRQLRQKIQEWQAEELGQ